MLRSAWIFLAAILLPSLVLAWLAVRSARDQQVLLEHQQAIISQDATDNLAKNVRTQIDALRAEFVQITQDLLGKSATPEAAASDFDRQLRGQWSPAEVGFAVNLRGNIYSPSRGNGAAARTFRDENERFLNNRENVEVYPSLNSSSPAARQQLVPSKEANAAATTRLSTPPDESHAMAQAPTAILSAPGGSTKDSVSEEPLAAAAPATMAPARESSRSVLTSPDADASALAGSISPSSRSQSESAGQAKQAEDKARSMSSAVSAPASPGTPAPDNGFYRKAMLKINQVNRQVSPQNNFNTTAAPLSNTVPEESDFRRLIGDDTSGALARFLDNKLQLMVWFRPSTGDMVFGAQLNQAQLLDKLRSVLAAPELKERDSAGYLSRGRNTSYCLALLDDAGHPVALSIPGFKADWKHPFVATEIGETLPHWEAALYLTDPGQMSKSARTLRLTLGLIVLLLVIAIVAGGSLIASDIRRQVRVAQQKTDFVSNVSHELKTPLTSIRMFADLLAEGRVTEPERQSTYLKIISSESARLTRLINNVLDFARLERGAPPGERRACDLVEITRDVAETCLPHLEANGQNLVCEIEAEALSILGDRDALAQVVLNLVSNAEKYGGGEILVRVRRQETAAGALGCVDVLDRGPGIPPRQVESIFLPFHRLQDSLANGIPGSGLGLTLARRMARDHGGDIHYTPRAGGGSCFTLTVPLTA